MSAWRSVALALALAACGDRASTKLVRTVDGRPAAVSRPAVRPGAVAAAEVLALPPPPAAVMRGQSRVVNLLRQADGTTPAVDVWARRTTDYGAVQLAHDVAYGTTSAWFAIPEGSAAMVVAAGAGVDGRAFGGVMVKAANPRQTALLFLNAGKPTVTPLPGPTAPPPPGQGELVLVASALRDAPLAGGTQFYVGDGTGACRNEPPRVLGGAARGVSVVASPGPVQITLHRWPGERCKLPAVFDATFEVTAGAARWVILHAPDGQTLRALTIEVGA